MPGGVNNPETAPGEAQLAVSGVSKHFGGVRAVEDVSLSVRRGELISIIGPNGAGKTSFLNMISGFYRPDTGSISFEGGTSPAPGPPDIANGDRPHLPEHRAVAGMTVLDTHAGPSCT